MSRNPYVSDDGSTALRPSVFVFMDILGYNDLIRSAERNGKGQEALNRLHKALSEARANLEDKYETELPLSGLGKKDSYALKAFTDNIVIGWPIHDDGEMETGLAFSKTTFFQFEMAIRGFFVRGALSIGSAYIDDIAVFGDALTQAYLGESTLARDPRIILTSNAVKAVKSHLRYYGNRKHAPQVSELLRDSDGQWFVNYLDCVLIAEHEQGPFYDELLKHKKAVEEKLSEFKDNPPIFSKYAWVAGYHNFFCDLHSSYFSGAHKINTDLFRARPTLIVE